MERLKELKMTKKVLLEKLAHVEKQIEVYTATMPEVKVVREVVLNSDSANMLIYKSTLAPEIVSPAVGKMEVTPAHDPDSPWNEAWETKKAVDPVVYTNKKKKSKK